MKGSEFLEKLIKLGDAKGISVKLIKERGKGSHSTIEYGNRFTTIRNLKDELKTGTFHAMLKQLGISKKDWRES